MRHPGNAAPPRRPFDALLQHLAVREPTFDPVLRDFLRAGEHDLQAKSAVSPLIHYRCFGKSCPWLYCLTLHTRGLVRDPGRGPQPAERFVVALRFLPDHLRRADSAEMLRLLEPLSAFHPAILPGVGGLCLQVHPGATPAEIALSLHDLFRYRVRQFLEADSLNPQACAWAREHVSAPLDDRPLFGSGTGIRWEPVPGGDQP